MEEKKENEQLDKIDGGAICEFKIQACFPEVFAIKDTGNLPISSSCNLRRDGLLLTWGGAQQGEA